MITKSEAVASLRPDTEWVMYGDDVEGIIWHTENVTPLTQSEVEAEILRLQAIAESAEQEKIADRESAMAKLSALGLSDNEVKAILGGI